MKTLRYRLWPAAGVVLAASAGSAAAQTVPGSTVVTPFTRPVKRVVAEEVVVAAPPSCGTHIVEAKPTWRLFGWWKPRPSTAACLWGYASEFEAPPLGSVMGGHFQAMVANGDAARMVLYRYDFVDGSDALTLRGRDQLAKIAALVSHNGCAVVVERTPENPGLAEARRAAVVAALGQNGLAVTPERVVVGVPLAVGLRGVEATELHKYQIQNTQTQAQPLPPPQSGVGGTFGGQGGLGGQGGQSGSGTTGTQGRR